MSKQLLKINGLSVNVEDKEILHGINLEIKKGGDSRADGAQRSG